MKESMDEAENILCSTKNSNSQEFVLPHKFAILTLIKAFCDIKGESRSPCDFSGEKKHTYAHTNQQSRDFAITSLKLIQGPAVELFDLHCLIKPILLPKTYDIFTTKLKELRDGGVAVLMDFIQSLESLMIDPQYSISLVHKSSVIGLYLRKIMLAFDKLSFSQVTRLYEQYKVYYDKSKIETEKHRDSVLITGSAMERNSIIEQYWKLTKSQVTSRKQAELFIGQQAALIQANEIKALPPKHLQEKIIQLLHGKHELAEAHYLSFLNAVRVQEICGATHSLYHCFDRSVLQAPHESKSSSMANNGDPDNRSTRYAALNLASLHSYFDHKEESVMTIKEAIAMAHEANDNVCLQHALLWLIRSNPENKEALLERFLIKTGEIGLPVLSALGMQTFAQSKALTAAQPSLVFDGMIKSDILICQHSMLDLMTYSYCQKAALWKLYGKTLMNSLTCQLLLNLNTSDPNCNGNYHNSEGICKALCLVAMDCVDNGNYSAAKDILTHCESNFPQRTKFASIWLSCKQLISYRRAVWETNWEAANVAVVNLSVVDETEAKYRKAELHFLQGQIKDCSHEISTMLQKYASDYHFRARLLLLKVEVLCQSSNFSMAATILSECLNLCRKKYLSYLEAMTKLYITHVQVQLGLSDEKMTVINEAVLYLLSHGSVHDQGKVYYMYARYILSNIYRSKESNPKPNLLKAIEHMRRAVELYRRVEAYVRVKDCTYWLSCLYNELGYTAERNQCAREFRLLDVQCPTSTGTSTGLL